MKKTFYILSALLLGLVSCNKTEIEPATPKKVEETGLVAVTMKLRIPEYELQARTRVSADGYCSDQPSIKAIRVAVFGTSGYPQAYSLAEPIASATNETVVDEYATTNGDVYYFKVLLPVYEGEAHVHVIANGDEYIQFVEQKENTIMEKMFTTDNVGAYWARVIMPDGILADVNTDGIMQTDEEGNYIPSAETAHLFEDLVLVRNFAEVVLDYQPMDGYDHLSQITWTLVNVPTKGSVAPMAAGTYVDDFKDYVYDSTTGEMKKGSTVYKGFMFSDEPMNNEIPEGSAITHNIFDTEGNPSPLFLYERRYPTEGKATCILMKAKYKNQSDWSYYRIDLMDEKVGGYYPIYRNFKYTVTIKKVGNKGANNPTEAMNRDSGGNVSQTTEAQSLTDISDGTSRLFVEYIEKNFTSGGKKRFWVYYIPNVSNGVIDNEGVSVTVHPKEPGNALKPNTGITKVGTLDGKDVYEFELKDQDENADLVSKFQVVATNGLTDDNKSTLYRDITVRVMKKMDMSLDLKPKKVEGQGSTTILEITLPEGLPSSMFPLELKIEDYNHAVAPTGEDGDGNKITVPVVVDKSLADGTTNSYYYIRTYNWDDYDPDQGGSNVVKTEFKTNKDNSATTIYVVNEYFKMQHINLLNDGLYVYPISSTVSFNTTSVDIEVECDDETKTWTVSGTSTDVTVVVLDADGNPKMEGETPVTTGTGSGKFRMSFPVNNSTTTDEVRTASVSSGSSDSHSVTVTQKALEFSITPNEQTVLFNATSATITVNAAEGKTWTARVSGTGAALTGADEEGKVSGEGTQTLTVTFPANTGEGSTTPKTFTVTATMEDPEAETSATISQQRGPDSSSTFSVSSFTYNGTDLTGAGTSADGYVTINLTNVGNYSTNLLGYYEAFVNPTTEGFIAMGRRANERSYWDWNDNYVLRQGSFTVTPSKGVKITSIKVTYSDATYAGYDFGNTSVQVTPGTYTRDGNNSRTATWTGSSTGVITFTNGYQNNTNSYNFPRITSIQVFYEPAE